MRIKEQDTRLTLQAHDDDDDDDSSFPYSSCIAVHRVVVLMVFNYLFLQIVVLSYVSDGSRSAFENLGY